MTWTRLLSDPISYITPHLKHPTRCRQEFHGLIKWAKSTQFLWDREHGGEKESVAEKGPSLQQVGKDAAVK